jgi:hypothetical protein
MTGDAAPLSEVLVGTWSLVSRVVRTSAGEQAPSHLGDDFVAPLIYDSSGNFAAQFMNRNGDADEPPAARAATSMRNNTPSSGGYDAYFGTYTVDDVHSSVTQTLVGSLAPANVGHVLTRVMSVDGDQLRIVVDTTTPDGQDAVITLVWQRSTA